MSRIIAGAAGGLRLQSVPGRDTRPTTDRVKESLFARLEAWGMLRDARVLDLFAGSGALGCEAASRGAAAVTLGCVGLVTFATVLRFTAAPGRGWAGLSVQAAAVAFPVVVGVWLGAGGSAS